MKMNVDKINKNSKAGVRIDRDYMGGVEIPAGAYWGPQTERARINFQISGIKQFKEFIIATAIVKRAAAEANYKTGHLEKKKAYAIMKAADDIISGNFDDQFVVDIYQAGAGTSHNMNVNEVIANRAIEILGGSKGDYKLIHPNDHVNMSQSTNDVIPTSIRIVVVNLTSQLMDALKQIINTLNSKAIEFDNIIKPGRTHLMDAAPVRLGQEFKAWSIMLEKNITKLIECQNRLCKLNIGATAVGTGLNADPKYVKYVVNIISRLTNTKFYETDFLPEATQSTADFLDLSGTLREIAVDMTKISNDLRLLNSGPDTAIGEIELPSVQPGSSIMPGKINPSVVEMMNMVSFHVIGNDTAIMMASQAGQLELNVMMPLIGYCLIYNLIILKNSIRTVSNLAISGIVANTERISELFNSSTGAALALNPYIGYDKTAEVVKKAVKENKKIEEVVMEMRLLSRNLVKKIFDPFELTEMGIAGSNKKRKHN